MLAARAEYASAGADARALGAGGRRGSGMGGGRSSAVSGAGPSHGGHGLFDGLLTRLRGVVSLNKCRFQRDGFDLDLTCVNRRTRLYGPLRPIS